MDPGLALIARCERGLAHRLAPWLFGAVTIGLVGWLWGSLNPLPWVYDEAAYLLQAKIFATGHWAAPGRPLPEFFEQVHVFVTPKLVPKYPPGHALLLVPGIWLGASALVPLLISGVTGGLVFGFARRLAAPWVGLLTWLVWITAPEELYIRPSFMSQVSTTLIWLLAWWCLSRWRRGGGGPSAALTAFAGLAAFGIITRPITALAFLIPSLAVILSEVVRRRAWSGLVRPTVVALPVLAIVALWSYRTSGRVFPTPYSEYSRVYVPWNMPGFRVDSSPPLREPTPALRKFRQEWLPLHQAHRMERLPAILAQRLRGIGITLWGGGWRWLLLGGLVLGLFGLPWEARFGLLSATALLLVYLWIAGRPQWTVYYLEVFPVLAFVTASGVWRVTRWLGGRLAVSAKAAGWTPEQLAAGLVVVGALAAAPGTVERLIRARGQQEDLRLVQHDLQRAVDSIPGKAIIFVASGPAHRPFESYVRNEPDLERARVWVVEDRGADNVRLAGYAPDRATYRFDPGTGVCTLWSATPSR